LSGKFKLALLIILQGERFEKDANIYFSIIDSGFTFGRFLLGIGGLEAIGRSVGPRLDESG